MRVGLGVGFRRRPASASAPLNLVGSTLAGCTLDLDAAVGYSGGTWSDQSGAGHDFGPSISAAIPSADATIGGKPALRFTQADSEYLGGISGGGSRAPTDLISVGAFTLFCVCKVVAVTTNNAAQYWQNACVIASDSGYWAGAYFRSAPGVGAGEIDAGTKQIASPPAIALGSDMLVTTWHSGGNLFVQVNGGTPVSVAAGNMGDTSGLVYIGKSQSNYLDAAIAKLVICSGYIGDSARDAANAVLKTFYGIP